MTGPLNSSTIDSEILAARRPLESGLEWLTSNET